jgi:hypothetical protein
MFIITALLATNLAITKPPKHHSSVPDSSDMTLVQVQNDRNVPVVVYAQDSWGEVKLGVVNADSTATFRLGKPIEPDAEIDFFVHPKGQLEEDTGNIDVRRGEHLGILVPPKK